MPTRNILIFHSGALGDFVLTWPLGLALGRLFPQSRVIYIAPSQKGALAGKILGLEASDCETGWPFLFGDADRLPESYRQKLVQSHSIFTFMSSPGDDWTKNAVRLAPQATLAFVRLRPVPGRHISQALVDALADQPAAAAAVRQILSSISTRGVGAFRFPAEGPMVIHPGSGSREKCWPVESFLQLIERLVGTGRKCRVLLGEVELERWPAEVIRRIESAAPTGRPVNYLELLEELRGARAFIGNDSGPTHLAAIIGLPTVAIFGPTDPVIWAPLGPRVQTIWHEPLADLAVSTVYDAMAKWIE